MKFNSKFTTVFLDPNNLDTSANGEKVNIILSPSLYWVQKISLPIKYARDAKKLLPSLFEEILPEGSYSYDTYKSGDEFFIFAYEDKLILDTLALSGISMSNVKNVYFAQSEMHDINGAVKINETQSVYVRDDIVVLVPCCWIEESGDLNLAHLTLSKHKVRLQQYGHIVDNSSLYKMGAILLVLSMLVFGEYIITTQKIAEISKLKDDVFEKYSLKPTMLQNRSMLKKYAGIHAKQTKIREYTSYLLSLRLQSRVKLSKLMLKNEILIAEFSNASRSTLSQIQKSLKSKKVKFKIENRDSKVYLEMIL